MYQTIKAKGASTGRAARNAALASSHSALLCLLAAAAGVNLVSI